MKEIDSSIDWETERSKFQEQIQKFEAALVEAKKVSPGGILSDLGAEYSVKLREAEQEPEKSSEKSRQERWSLNEEIENLEAALRKAGWLTFRRPK